MYAKGTLADLADPFVQPRIEREIKQELSSQRLRAAQSDPVTIVGRALALIFCVCVCDGSYRPWCCSLWASIE